MFFAKVQSHEEWCENLKTGEAFVVHYTVCFNGVRKLLM